MTVTSRAGNLADSADQQQSIRTRTADVAGQLDSVITDLRNNGIAGGDVKTLDAVRSVLGQLSDGQMKQVAEILHDAAAANDPARAAKSLDGQSQIINKLRELLVEYQRQQAMDAAANKVAELAERQDANLQQTVDLARRTNNVEPAKMTPEQKQSLADQKAEQKKIAAELNRAADDLRELQSPADPAKAVEAVHAADKDLSDDKLFKAAADQKQARDALRDLAKQLAPPQDKQAQLRQAAAKIDEAIAQQKQIDDDARKLGPKYAPTTDLKQGRNADRAETVQKDLTDVAPAAVEQLKQARQSMAEARQAMGQKKMDVAAAKGDAAVKSLQQARAEVGKQLDDQPPPAAQDAAAQLADLKAAEQAMADHKTPAADEPQQQAKLTAKARDLQADLAQKDPTAAAALDAAAKHMSYAQDHLDKHRNGAAKNEQKAAVAELAKAQGEINQLAAKEKKDQDELEKVKTAENAVDKAIAKQTEAIKADKKAEPQKQATDAIDGAAKALELTAGDAKQNVVDAKKSAESAESSIDKHDDPATGEHQKTALADLQKAKDSLDQQASQMQDKLGLAKGSGKGGAKGNPKGRPVARAGDPQKGPTDGVADPNGPRTDTRGPGQFLNLPPRDRAAIQQSQGDKYPRQYSELVEQYYRNLSDGGGK